MSTKRGRNDPCPCGSGKKYKKCCGLKNQPRPARSETPGAFLGAAPNQPYSPGPVVSGLPDGLNLHPYMLVRMLDKPSPELLARLPADFLQRTADRWTISKVAALNTEQILARLHAFGVAVSAEEFRDRNPSVWSAWEIGEQWLDEIVRKPTFVDEDFFGLAACELWKRVCPERPSMEMLDDWMQDGYDAKESGDTATCIDLWLRVWDVLRSRLTPQMRCCDDALPVFNGTQSLFNWTQDLANALLEGADVDRRCAERGIRFAQDIVWQFPDQDELYVMNFRCDLGRFYFRDGRPQDGEAVLRDLIDDYPHRAQPYGVLADEFGLFAHGQPDYARAIEVLELALAYPVEDANDWSIPRRLDDCRKRRMGQSSRP
ncbi:MAG: hypothetical protein A3K19_01630 [Lentisphaerae bacterium RIFOXYB12_FULL_65_16]|nr:MAG: hypothetical protein A3K18_02835 [Lentisphaerae bacterium RIFOXYA12_64_32]OGV92851.1 MAG: hypothetical protein A3K19_01630 [Lentisphaerae bacterium RIFOXYB12_FULL_65_16]